jgi:hypothetical protein
MRRAAAEGKSMFNEGLTRAKPAKGASRTKKEPRIARLSGVKQGGVKLNGTGHSVESRRLDAHSKRP